MTKVVLPCDIHKCLSLENLDGEFWCPIPNYEGMYEASNLGRLKSLPRFAEGRHGGMRPIGNKIMKLNWENRRYATVYLGKDSLRFCCLVHRIIALTFIPNPENLPCINHKDGNRLNNSLSNLEWCTHKQNTKHARDTKLLISPRGEAHYESTLTELQVIKMRKIGCNWYDAYQNCANLLQPTKKSK